MLEDGRPLGPLRLRDLEPVHLGGFVRRRGAGHTSSNRITDRGRDRERAVPLVDTFDDRPWRAGRAGPLDDPFGRGDELAAHAPVLPLQLADTPARELVAFEFLQTLLVRGAAEVHPELENQHAVVGKRLLELGDPAEVIVELGGFVAAVDPREQRRRVPRAEVEAHAAAWRKRAPVAPELRPFRFLVRRLAERRRDDPSRIHPFGQEVDGLTLARAIDAREDDDDGEAGLFPQTALRIEQIRAQTRRTRPVLGLRDGTAELGGFEHGFSRKAVCGLTRHSADAQSRSA